MSGLHQAPRPPSLSRRALLVGSGALAAAGVGALVTGAFVHSAADAGAAPRRPTPSLAGGASLPRIYTTAEWGARRVKGSSEIIRNAPKYVVIHHTETRNGTPPTLERAFRLGKGIQNYHMRKGWGDTGQHFTVSRGGYVLEGRHGSLEATHEARFVRGVQTRNSNDFTVGIECEGTYHDRQPPEELLESLLPLVAWMCSQYGLDPHEAVQPHRRFTDTDCCGDEFVATLGEVRKEVARLMARLYD